jgi:hypothetical protein
MYARFADRPASADLLGFRIPLTRVLGGSILLDPRWVPNVHGRVDHERADP